MARLPLPIFFGFPYLSRLYQTVAPYHLMPPNSASVVHLEGGVVVGPCDHDGSVKGPKPNSDLGRELLPQPSPHPTIPRSIVVLRRLLRRCDLHPLELELLDQEKGDGEQYVAVRGWLGQR